MKKNILSRSFVLKIAVMLWTISFGSSVLAAEYISTLDLKWTDCGTTFDESVNVTVDLGETHELIALGYISGILQLNVIHHTKILTGTWAGWSWRHSTYTLGGYSGHFYQIYDNNTHKAWGHARGDIFAAARKVDDTRIWHITSVNGQQVTGTIYLTYNSGTAPISTTDYYDTNLRIKPGDARFDGTSSGYYTGTFMNTATGVWLTGPNFFPERGFAIPQYVTDIGSGIGYMFFADPDFPEATLRYGTWDGPFFGIQTRGWGGPCEEGMDVWATHQHVLGGSASVPAGSGVTATIPVSPTSEIAVNFENVSSGSVTAQKTSALSPSSYYSIVGSVYDITTTASYSGTVQVCLSYNDSDVIGLESDLKLLHYTGSEWETLPSSVDTTNNIVCGSTSSLSLFGIGGRGSSASGTSSKVPVFNGWWLLMGILPGLFLILRRVRRGRKSDL